MTRRLYAERTSLSVKDLKDQPDSKYVAVIHDLLGQKTYITCDGIIINDQVITLIRVEKSSGLQVGDKVQQDKQMPVCSFPTRSGWAMLQRDRFIEMTGEEWEKYQVEDGQNFKQVRKDAVKSDIVEAIAMPNGQLVAIPASPEARKEYENAMKCKDTRPKDATPYDDSSLYA